MANTNTAVKLPTLTGEEAKGLQIAIYDMELLFMTLGALPAVGTQGNVLAGQAVQEVVLRALCREGRALADVASGILETAGFYDQEWQAQENTGHE